MQVYGVDVAASASYAVLPFVVTLGATNAAGWIADGLVNNEVRVLVCVGACGGGWGWLG